jgi:hypothetical protein
MSTPTPLLERLAGLPRKISVPLRSLVESQQLSAEILETLLDAAELSQDPSKLIGFAIAFLYMTQQRVPVQDTIRMAKSQGRRINLEWSSQRWQLEHARFSRAETLGRLSAENERYDLDRFAAKLPQRFCGYLIRSSRRLGMEGLRQRHCVASYHNAIKAGHTAICVVFANRRRWTVELGLTGGDGHPLRIVQIKTRLNARPDGKEREAIFRILGIDSRTHIIPADEISTERAYLENLRRVLPMLRAEHVDNVCVSFDGCGDEGTVEDIDFGTSKGYVGKQRVTIIALQVRLGEDHQLTRRRLEKATTVSQAIETITYDYLEVSGVN